jgi:membrane protease YdiL (CAAX protease family)
MNWLPEIHKQELLLLIILLSGLLLFYVYWLVFDSKKIKTYFHSNNDSKKASINHIFFTKVMGFIIMGVIPLIFSFFLFENPIIDLGFVIPSHFISFSIRSIIIISLIAIILGFFGSRQQKSLAVYPQIRINEWSVKSLFISLFGWVLYLFGYELLFRGFLLLPIADILGFWPAITISTILYSTTHLPKGIREALGAIPLGVLLGSVCLVADNFWIGFFVHIVMSWTVNLSSIYWNPEMSFKR